MDKASKITAYRIKDIVIKLEGGQLVITRETERKTLSVDALLKQPSMVFDGV
ncbi:hypothetical protein ACNR9V_13030 [Parageobacillus thermoglucosidasius]|uniref:hypothetical protein n=1 Tax=Parageobacillus thermoglucosidasius TaxID=1426 RepID=UPI003B68036F